MFPVKYSMKFKKKKNPIVFVKYCPHWNIIPGKSH